MDGFLLIDKPIGMTSRSVCNYIGKIFKTKKVGHIGTLDPFASGLLIVNINKANKAGTFLDDFSKEYIASLVLGVSTDSGDIEGRIIKKEDVKTYSKTEIEEALNSFLGESEQIPPMTSAIHVDGVRLYELARQGKEIERKPRKIYINNIECLDYQTNILTFKAFVSKGTYIRVLGEDIAKKLGTIGHLNALRRTKVGSFNIEEATKLEDINESSLISIKDVLSRFSDIKKVDEKEELDIKNGKIKYLDYPTDKDKLLIVNNNDDVIAMYIKEDNRFVFKRGLF